ncbi:MAG: hypothetical protein FWG73_02300 [Planctomycetaceae bacterium]|nr:hypothetical protein [Planctomycetaceae bacterium]
MGTGSGSRIGTVSLVNSKIIGNVVNTTSSDWMYRSPGDAGIFNSGVLAITNGTIAGSSSILEGGGIYNFGEDSALIMNNSIVAGNFSDSYGEDICWYHENLSGSHNLIGNGTGQSALIDGTNGNIVSTAISPIDPKFVNAQGNDWKNWDLSPRRRFARH